MSTLQPEPARDEQMEQSVIDYLREHPDFLVRHPEVVDTLLVPHTSGEAVSLIEYQSKRLRDENRILRERLETLVGNARENEEYSRRIHRLTLDIMECATADALFSCLYQGLQDHFDVEFTALRLFCVPALPEDSGLAEFVGGEAPEKELFRPLGRLPECGPPDAAQCAWLFPEQSEEVKSNAVIPLGGAWRVGVLAIGSRDPERYATGMGTVFLRQIAALVTRALEPYVVKWS